MACLWIDAACRLTNDHLRPGAVPTSWKAVRGFFIPGWNVIHSYRVFAALRRAADPLGLPASNEHEPVDAAGYRSPALQERASFHWRVPAPVGPWCAAYWTWLGATLVIGRLRATHDLSTMQWTSLVLFKSALMLVAGTLFLLVMRGIDRRQTERVRRLLAMTDASECTRPVGDER